MKKDQPRFQNWLNVLSCGSWLYSYRQGCLSRVAVVLFPDTCAASQREQQERHHNRLPIKHHITALTTTELHPKLMHSGRKALLSLNSRVSILQEAISHSDSRASIGVWICSSAALWKWTIASPGLFISYTQIYKQDHNMIKHRGTRWICHFNSFINRKPLHVLQWLMSHLQSIAKLHWETGRHNRLIHLNIDLNNI